MRILDVLNNPWAIQPEKLQEISDVYSRHLKGEKIDIKGIEAKAGEPFDNQPQGYDVINGVAIVPIDGVIAKKMNLFSRISGGASTEMIARDFTQAMNDEDVHSVILNIDSPGGTVDGTADLGDVIFNARGTKPVVAFADGLMASAAYWIGSAADQIYASNDTAIIGSIGVVSTHVDYSEQLKNEGVKVTEIYAGKFKRIASEYEPLTKEGKDSMQDHVDYLYSVFVGTVAKHRGVDDKIVLDDMADGRLFIGQQAVDAGLVDGVTTLEALINKLNSDNLVTIHIPDNLFSQEDLIELSAEINQELEAQEMPKDIITKADVESNLPDVADALRNEGKASVDVDSTKTNAAKAERERIQAVQDQSMPGHEALINELAFDGKTTGPEAAVKVLQAEKSKAANVSQNLETDAEDVSGIVASVEENLSTEDNIKKEWASDEKLRKEFTSIDQYISFKQLESKNKE